MSFPITMVNLKILSLITIGMFFTFKVVSSSSRSSSASSWCVARSDASDEALQSALDYACGHGADCEAIKESGICFIPDTLQAHASYAFNSFYQLKAMAATSCSFSGTSTIAKTDPSYGSCTYPSYLTSSSQGGGGATSSSRAPPEVTAQPPSTIMHAPPSNLYVPSPPAGTTMPSAGPASLSGGGTVPEFPNGQSSISSLGLGSLANILFFSIFTLLFTHII